MGSGIYIVAVAFLVLAAACYLVGLLNALQQYRQPGSDSSAPMTTPARSWMKVGVVLSVAGSALLLSTLFWK